MLIERKDDIAEEEKANIVKVNLKEKKREEEMRDKALDAAKRQTAKMKKKIRSEWEALESLKDIEVEETAIITEPEENEEQYFYYYQDSNTTDASVLGMAVNADLVQIKRFVGSLRYHGFQGCIMLGIGSDADKEILDYFEKQHVTVKIVQTTPCTYESARSDELCNLPYPNIKVEWSPFPLARDWLAACEGCTGPILFTSVHNVFFQKNPFGEGMPLVEKLQLFQEHWDVKYGQQTPTAYLLQACKDIDPRTNQEGHLTSEIAIGRREDMNTYLTHVYYQMKAWMLKSECHFKYANLDTGQAIVNFMRLSDRLPEYTRFKPHRKGVANIVGYEGQLAYEAHLHFWRFKGLSEEEAKKIPYEGAEGNNWIDSDYKLTDDDGYFIDIFFRRSAIVHEYDKFGQPYLTWLDNNIGKTFSTFTFDPKNSGNVKASNGSGDNDSQESLLSEGIMTLGQIEKYKKAKLIPPEEIYSGSDELKESILDKANIISKTEKNKATEEDSNNVSDNQIGKLKASAGGNTAVTNSEDGNGNVTSATNLEIEKEKENEPKADDVNTPENPLKNPEIENDEENEPKPDNVDTRIKTLKKAGGNDSLNGPIDTAEKEELRYYPVAENSKAKKNSSMRKDTKTKNVGLRGQTVVIEKVGHSDRKERVVDSHTGNDDAESKDNDVGLRGHTVRKERVADSDTDNDTAESKDDDHNDDNANKQRDKNERTRGTEKVGHSARKERVVDGDTGNNAAESKDNDDNNDVGLRGHSTRKERVLEGDTDNDTAESKDNDDHDNEQTDKNGRTREIEKVVHPARKERVVDDVTGNDDAESKGNNDDDDVVLRGHSVRKERVVEGDTDNDTAESNDDNDDHDNKQRDKNGRTREIEKVGHSARKERVVDGDTGNDDAESKDNDDNDDNANEQRDKNGRTRVIEKVGHSTRKERVVDGDAGNYDAESNANDDVGLKRYSARKERE